MLPLLIRRIGTHTLPPPAYARKCWVYYPEAAYPFFRLTVFSNYSPHNVPDPSRQVPYGR